MNIDLIIFALVCGITFLLRGGYMSERRRQSTEGRLKILITNVTFWGVVIYAMYKLVAFVL